MSHFVINKTYHIDSKQLCKIKTTILYCLILFILFLVDSLPNIIQSLSKKYDVLVDYSFTIFIRPKSAEEQISSHILCTIHTLQNHNTPIFILIAFNVTTWNRYLKVAHASCTSFGSLKAPASLLVRPIWDN